MKKRSLFSVVMVICLAVSMMLFEQITAYADVTLPVHEYNFDSDSYTAVMDLDNENAIDGIANGTNSSTLVAGYNGTGNARQFNGADDYISFSNPVIPIGAKSIRFKVKKDSIAKDGLWESIISNLTTSKEGFYVGIGTTYQDTIPGGVYFIYSKSASDVFNIQTPVSICDGKWHDILFTWAGTTNTNSVKLYLDDMTIPVAQETPTRTESTQGNNLSIGRSDYSGYKENVVNFNGYLDNIQIYDTVITANTSTPVISSNLKAVSEDSKVDLTWNAVTNATSYTVKRSKTAGGPYTTIATGITETTYTDTDVNNGTTYYYVVTAIVNDSEGWNSNEASATPQASTDQPAGNKALLVISMVTGERKEYEMTADEINDFIAWYNSKAASIPTYVIEKDYNKASFTARKDYIAYEQISNFEVNEYNN